MFKKNVRFCRSCAFPVHTVETIWHDHSNDSKNRVHSVMEKCQ